MQSSSKFGRVFFKVIQDSPPPATAQPCENIFVETSSVTCRRLSFLVPYRNILLFIQHFTRFKGIIGMNIPPFWTQRKSSEIAWIWCPKLRAWYPKQVERLQYECVSLQAKRWRGIISAWWGRDDFYPAHEGIASFRKQPFLQMERDPWISSVRYGAVDIIGAVSWVCTSCPWKVLSEGLLSPICWIFLILKFILVRAFNF